MTVNCEWVEQNLEALSCETLTESETRVARAHIENCAACRKEVHALGAIDGIVKRHFNRQLAVARRGHVVHKGRVIGFGGAVAAFVALSMILLIHKPETTRNGVPVTAPPTEPPAVSVQPAPPIKSDEPGEVQRAKPSTELGIPADRPPQIRPPVPPNGSEFLVTDPAGYSHILDEYRGRRVVIGVWSAGQTESIEAIERLYKTYAGDTKLRFLGVALQHQPKPPNTTFPLLYNEGSKLLGAASGEFVLVDPTGKVELRGSLVKDIEALRRALESK